MKNNNILMMITESTDDIQLIKEDFNPSNPKPKTVKFKGIFLVSERKNGNGRIYPYLELKEEVDRFREEMINTNRALMELEHP